MVFYYYYDQLCKAINSSPCVTQEVTDAYGKIINFVADRHHIYLLPRAQEGNDRHISYYRMMQEDIEQVIKDQSEVWVENPEKQKEKDKGKGKEKETMPEIRKDPGKEKEKKESKRKEEKTMLEKDKEETERSKASIGKKRPSTVDTGSSPRKKRESSKLTLQIVLHEDNIESIEDRVYGTMLESITSITTAQEALKQTIET